MKVLYYNHTAHMSGAERSLIDLLASLPPGVTPLLACPEGPLAAAARALEVPVTRTRGIEASLRLHPWHTLRGVQALLSESRRLRALAARFEADLIHANSVRAGLAAVLATRAGGPTSVVHVRDCLPAGAAAGLTRRIAGRADLVIANSRYTAANFAPGGCRATLRVVHNPVDLVRFDPTALSRIEARAQLGLPAAAPLLGVVAQITPWKGQDDAIRILARLLPSQPGLRLLIVGEAKFVAAGVRYDNPAYLRSLHRLARELGVSSSVHFLGERPDVPRIMRALDLLLVPSWEEPFGRIVLEAMAMETVVLATALGGPAEILAGGQGGLVLPPRDPDAWAAALLPLLADPQVRACMGNAGRAVAVSYSRAAHSQAIVAAYDDVLTERSRTAGRQSTASSAARGRLDA